MLDIVLGVIYMTYATTKQVLDLIGLSNNINHENVGTGDNSNKDFDLDHENVIATSYTLYYGASGSNTFTDLVETEDYTLDKPKGKISLTNTGLAKLQTKVLYGKYVWCEPFNDTEVSNQLAFADDEVNEMTDRKWDTATDFTEEFDYEEILNASNYSIYTTTEDRASEKLPKNFIVSKYKPLSSITKIEFYDADGSELTDDELTGDNYPDEFEWYDYGKIVIKDYEPSTACKKIKVTGTYGMTNTPNKITELTCWLTGLRLYMNLSGGSYNDVTSYTLGGVSIGVGEPYVNIAEFMKQANKRIEQLMRWIGQRQIIMGV